LLVPGEGLLRLHRALGFSGGGKGRILSHFAPKIKSDLMGEEAKMRL